MFLIRAEDENSLLAIQDDFEAVADFDHVDLGDPDIATLSEWFGHSPIVFQEEDGLCIVQFSTDGADWLLRLGSGLAEFGADPNAVTEFLLRSKVGKLYALTTF